MSLCRLTSSINVKTNFNTLLFDSRCEAEFARIRLRSNDIVPVVVGDDYKPQGWLGMRQELLNQGHALSMSRLC